MATAFFSVCLHQKNCSGMEQLWARQGGVFLQVKVEGEGTGEERGRVEDE